jgi:hypothetical protein
MGVMDKLKKVGKYARKGWQSTDPDSYSHYKRGRERKRKQAERGRKDADRSGAAEEAQTEAPWDDTGKAE